MTPEITVYIALYGAILGTLGFVVSLILAINELGKSKPKIRVSLHHARLTDPDGKSSEPLIGVDVVNEGNHSVRLSSCGWLRKDKYKDVILNLYRVNFPFTLEPGRRLNIFLAVRWYRDNGDMGLRYAFFVQDETSKTWRAKISRKIRREWMNLEIEGWKILWNKETRLYLEEYRVPADLRGQFI